MAAEEAKTREAGQIFRRGGDFNFLGQELA